MRGLNKKQKKLIERWFKEHKDEIGYNWDCRKDETFPCWEVLDINDFETICQEINNYVGELLDKEIHKKGW